MARAFSSNHVNSFESRSDVIERHHRMKMSGVEFGILGKEKSKVFYLLLKEFLKSLLKKLWGENVYFHK